MNPTRLSKFMSLVLRHRANAFGLTLDAEGFVALDVLALIVRDRVGASLSEIIPVVENSLPRRFEIREGMIRATYGHSRRNIAPVNYPVAIPPALLYHGTHAQALPSIRKTGLQAMQRQYVHLSTTIERVLQVARRRTAAPVILSILAVDAHAAGVAFYSPEPNHFLARAIPPQFIQFPKKDAQ
jgi:putative RNA 2'-phosphotransferase